MITLASVFDFYLVGRYVGSFICSREDSAKARRGFAFRRRRSSTNSGDGSPGHALLYCGMMILDSGSEHKPWFGTI